MFGTAGVLMKSCIQLLGHLPTQNTAEKVAFPRSKSRNVVRTAHLLGFSECLVGEPGKRWVGSECQIHVAVRQSAVGSRIASARQQPLGFAIEGMKPALQKHVIVGRTIATTLRDFAIVVSACF